MSARDGDALLLAAGDPTGDRARQLFDAEVLEQLAPARARLARRQARQQAGQLDVVGDREVRDEVEELEDEAHLAAAQQRPGRLAELVDPAAAEVDLAGGRSVEPAEQVQQRRLAAARGPHDADELALGDRQVDTAQRRDGDPVGFVGPLETGAD
jgi:hypothetical protein